MSADDKARKLAEKIVAEQERAAEAAVRYVLKHKTADPSLVNKSGVLTATIPYATALLAAEEGLEESVEYLSSNTPSNSYGLIDHSADRERSQALALARAALSTIKGLL